MLKFSCHCWLKYFDVLLFNPSVKIDKDKQLVILEEEHEVR